MQIYSGVCRDVNGNAVTRAPVTLFQSDGVTPVPSGNVFQTDGKTVLGNPFATDAAGRILFATADGKYIGQVAAPDGDILVNITVFDPSGSPPNVQSGSTYGLMPGDEITGVIATYNGGCAINVPADNEQPFNVGAIILIESQGVQPVTFTSTAGVTLNPSSSSFTARAQYSVMALKKTASNTWTLFGDVQ